MKTYKEAVSSENNIQPLSDDYIKFLRFAHWKMEKVKRGVIGVITNNSFIDGLIHRGIREELCKTFDTIYILNLNGNSNIGDVCEDGSKDENVFDIKQGVCISLFVKGFSREKREAGSENALTSIRHNLKLATQSSANNSVPNNQLPTPNTQIYYYSLQGLRKSKYDFLYSNTVSTVPWEQLHIEKPYYWFKKKDMSLQDEYSKFWSLADVFEVYSVGIVTGNDQDKVTFKESTISHFYFRPFDFRYINLYDSELQRPRLPFMSLYEKYNIGLLVSKQCKKEFNHLLVTNCPSSKHVIGDAAYNFPLYTYYNNTKTINFTSKFTEFWKSHSYWKTKTEEEILAYIYACLHSSNYRKRYFEFLKIDFPRVSFNVTRASSSQTEVTESLDQDGRVIAHFN